MCCRDGLDKPPKPSTKANNTKPSTLLQPNKQASTISRGKQPAALHQSTIGHAQSWKAPGIERVDLTSGGQREVHTGLVVQKPKGLDHLHSSVQKAAPLDLITQKQPSFSYAKGTRPSLSFLDEPVQGLGKILSDYDDSWMDDFPSPSALVNNTAPMASSLLRRVSGENHGAAAYDDSMSELEACMVGLDDSMVLDNGKVDTAISATPRAFPNDGEPDDSDLELVRNWLSSPKATSTEKPESKQRSEGSKSQAIFMSTDSLQRPDSSSPVRNSQSKRRLETIKGSDYLTEVGCPAKKHKVSGHHEVQDQHTATDSGPRMSPNHDVAGKTGVKPGWEGIDPELFAEYGNIVDIVES